MRVVLIHGFTQNRRCWAPFDRALTPVAELVRLDAPGHGVAAGVAADVPGAASWLARAGGAGVYLGYSMGGRIALQLALDHPLLVHGLVLVSASPGIADSAERAARRAADERLADRIEQLSIESFLGEWLAQPLFSTLPRERAHISARARNSPAGVSSSLRLAGAGAQAPLWDRLSELTMPVLIVTGALDARYTAIGQAMAQAIGSHSELVEIAGAGHTVHLERPAETARAVNRWLAQHVPAGTSPRGRRP